MITSNTNAFSIYYDRPMTYTSDDLKSTLLSVPKDCSPGLWVCEFYMKQARWKLVLTFNIVFFFFFNFVKK